jgi:hypothetical protein
MGFDEAILRCFSKYAVFVGRVRSSESWWVMVRYVSASAMSNSFR